MKTFKRFLSALWFYPVFYLWFIPRQKYVAWKKSEFEYIYGPNPEDPNETVLLEKKKRSKEARQEMYNLLYTTEIQVALAGRRRLTSKKERNSVYQEHLKAIKNESQEDKIFGDLGIKDDFK